LVIKVLLDHKVLLVQEFKDHKVKLGHKDHKDPLDHKGNKVLQGQWALLVVRARKEQKARKARKDHRDLGHKGHKGHKGQLAVATYPDHKVHKGLGRKLLCKMKERRLPAMSLL
jgi:hypothetical protein